MDARSKGENSREPKAKRLPGGASLDATAVATFHLAMSRCPLLRRLLVAGLVFGAALAMRAQLVSKSPFMSARSAGPATPEAGAPLEFRGYMELGGVLQVRLYDPAKKQSVWAALNERNAELDVVARQLNRERGTLMVEHRGALHTLEIRTSKVVSGGPVSAAPPLPVAPPANVMPAVTQSVVLNPSAEDEKRRLESVAAEVARRRQLREQAAQNVNQAQAAAQPPRQP